MTDALTETQLSFPLIHRGKVRDTYDLGDDTLLLGGDGSRLRL